MEKNDEEQITKFLKSKIEWDWFSIICFIIMIIGIAMITFYFFQERVNECTKDPIKFGMNKILETTDLEGVNINMVFMKGGFSAGNRFITATRNSKGEIEYTFSES